MPNASTTVKPNTTPNSIKDVQLKGVTFTDLWNNYASGKPYNDPTNQYENQCAIRMSVTLHRIGVEIKSFSQKLIKPMPGKPTIGRILLDGKASATRAYEMAEWLRLKPFAGLPSSPRDITGPDWQSKVAGKTGIIYFYGYWRQDGDSGDQLSGGHIDLWNRDTLTPSLTSFVRFRMGWNSAWYSDLGLSKQILFWEMKQ